MTYAQARSRRPHGKASGHRFLTFGLMAVAAALVCAPIAYIVWPEAAPVARDAPSLPITVGGVTFNVPPAAVRVKMQRRAGTQSRVDLVFLWPSLKPPDPSAKPSPADIPGLTERVFLTIAGGDNTLPPIERLNAIYPRYTAGPPIAGPDGLTVHSFRASTPYQGEDLIYDASAPERFLLRCTERAGVTPGMCLHERRMAGADLTVRFPRDWLTDWRKVASGIDALIASLRPHGG
jgi:hypothetical protein